MSEIVYEKMGKQTFVNPYNFVRCDLEHDIVKMDIAEKDIINNKLTGVMTVNIKTKTPITILDTVNKENEKLSDNKEHPIYKFMKSPDGKYMIPGSSIRGMVRNVYETATESCFSTMRENIMLDSRAGSAAKPGILLKEDSRWVLYRANRYKLKVKNNKKMANCYTYEILMDENNLKYIEHNGERSYSGDKVKFKILANEQIAEKIIESSSCEGTDGYLVIGEDIPNKYYDSIFKEIELKERKQDIINNALERMEKSLKIYRNKSINKKYPNEHNGYPNYDRMKKNGCIPIWYSENNNNYYFMLAAIGRKVFENKLDDIVKTKKPCIKRKELCPACSLFGMIGNNEAVGSRIRFTDAHILSEISKKLSTVTLSELSSPRPSYMPFYVELGEDISGKNLPDYDKGNIKIKGRKFYWHSDNYSYINNNIEKTDRNATVEIIDEKKEFCFKVYFDQITEEELKKLVWSINFWENDKDGCMCHKIGHGKPIGLGSVKLSIDEIKTRKFSMDKGYHEEIFDIDYSKEEPVNNTFSSVKDLRVICNYNNKQDVSYPYIEYDKNDINDIKENDIANHRWFTENKSAGKKGHDHEMQKLAYISGIDGNLVNQELHTYVAKCK